MKRNYADLRGSSVSAGNVKPKADYTYTVHGLRMKTFILHLQEDKKVL